MTRVGPVVVDGDTLLVIAAAMRSNFIHTDILAKQLTELVAEGAAARLLPRAMAELRRLPCRSAPCEGCSILAEFARLGGPGA